MCSNASYTEQNDFVERAEAFTEELTKKKAEATKVEEAEKEKLANRCLRANGGGGYGVGKREDSYFLPPPDKAPVLDRDSPFDAPSQENRMPESNGASRVGAGALLSAAEVAARCADDPEALFLCDLALRDSDMDAVCEGLRRGGSRLTALDLSHNALGDKGMQRIASELARKTCPQLRELWVGGNNFSELGAKALTEGLTAIRRDLAVHLDDSGGNDSSASRAAQQPPAAQAAAVGVEQQTQSIAASSEKDSEVSPSPTPSSAQPAQMEEMD